MSHTAGFNRSYSHSMRFIHLYCTKFDVGVNTVYETRTLFCWSKKFLHFALVDLKGKHAHAKHNDTVTYIQL